MDRELRLVELHATCTVGEFNRNNGIVNAEPQGRGCPIVAVTMIETLGSCQCVDPIEVILDGATSLCVSPVVSTYPEPKYETRTWRERKDARPKCRCPALLSGCDCNVDYVTKSKVVHTNPFYLRATEILEAPSAPLAPFLNVAVFDSIKIKDLHEDTLIQVVGYNIEETNDYFTTWLFN